MALAASPWRRIRGELATWFPLPGMTLEENNFSAVLAGDGMPIPVKTPGLKPRQHDFIRFLVEEKYELLSSDGKISVPRLEKN